MQKAVCVFSSSSDALAPEFFAVAEELGAALAHAGYALIYGGARVGLMGAVARSVHQHGGHVIGVIPESIRNLGIAYDAADEFIVTRDLRERKAIMETRADAFIGLPGGFGTLEEVLEILTLKQLQLHTKPVVLLNTAEFYAPLIALFEHIYEHRFAKPSTRQLYHFAPTVAEAFAYLTAYSPPTLDGKWF
jgi:uncharacterized protein (TIGR00730 family)